jgi:hypothetical protein
MIYLSPSCIGTKALITLRQPKRPMSRLCGTVAVRPPRPPVGPPELDPKLNRVLRLSSF